MYKQKMLKTLKKLLLKKYNFICKKDKKKYIKNQRGRRLEKNDSKIGNKYYK